MFAVFGFRLRLHCLLDRGGRDDLSNLVLDAPGLCFSSYFALSRFEVLWFALPAVGYALLLSAVGSALVLPAVGFALLPAVGFARLPAVGFALLGSFQRCSRSSMFFSLSSYPCCFTSFFSPLCSLFGCGSFSASSSASLWGKLRLRGAFLASSNITTQRCALRDWWFAVSALDPRERSLQQRVLLLWGLVWEVRCFCCSSVFSNATVWCSGLRPPSQWRLASRPPVTAWSCGSSNTAGWSSILASLSLSSGPDWKSLSLSHAASLHVCWWLFCLSPVTVTCFAMSFALRSAAIVCLILDAYFLHTGATHAFDFCVAVRTVCWMMFLLYLLLSSVFVLNVDIRLCGPGFTSLSAGLPRWSFLALFQLRLLEVGLQYVLDLAASHRLGTCVATPQRF